MPYIAITIKKESYRRLREWCRDMSMARCIEKIIELLELVEKYFKK